MKIQFIDIQNFRKLKCTHMTFADETTLLVGANNSGKTSAMHALIYFLHDHKSFRVTDFTASHWNKINKIGSIWEDENTTESELEKANELWNEVVPSLDVWLNVETNEIHRVSHIIPSLNWSGGLLGVRLRFEPSNIESLKSEYLTQRFTTLKTLEAATQTKGEQELKVQLWPTNLREYLSKKLSKHFNIKSYILNPYILSEKPQELPIGSEPLEAFPLDGIVKVDLVSAQRGFSNAERSYRKGSSTENTNYSRSAGNLTSQLQEYYKEHLDPTEFSEPSDIEALEAIYKAQAFFDNKLQDGFKMPFKEIHGLGYPGFTDPKISISTQIAPMDGLNHESAVQFEVSSNEQDIGVLRLPEYTNGLGYQNLIYIIFKLMMFRDSWLRLGKASKRINSNNPKEVFIQPLHLVLMEEPEAHLHAQVQQVFIQKAYNVLRQHEDLLDGSILTTQLVVSTHSSHIAHKQDFASMRYFKRLKKSATIDVPTSIVIDLATTFGAGKDEEERKQIEDTERFVTRYIEATHCDLFFADAAILIEGASERMLLPHFIKNDECRDLSKGYISILEVGGNHAHRFRPLIERLGLLTLIITDIDAGEIIDGKSPKKTRPMMKEGQITSNTTLAKWVPEKSDIDELLVLKESEKVMNYPSGFAVRVAYQRPTSTELKGKYNITHASTFEDALALENTEFFSQSKGIGLIKRFRNSVNKSSNHSELSNALFENIDGSTKAEFALNLLYEPNLEELKTPEYIAEGLIWLQNQIVPKKDSQTNS